MTEAIKKVDLQELLRKRNAKLGLVLLVLLTITFVVTNRFVYLWLDSAGNGFERVVSTCLAGIVLSEFYLLIIWTVLSSDQFLKRLQFLACASIALLAAWLLGYVMKQFPKDMGLNFANRDEFYFLGWIPFLFVASSIPFIVVRFFWRRVLGKTHEKPPRRSPITVLGLMVTTGIVAVALASAQAPALVGMEQAELWTALGFISAFFFGASLLVVLPVSLILLSQRVHFLLAAFIALLGVTGIASGVFLLLSRFRTIMRSQDIPYAVTLVVVAAASLVLGILVMRLFGYRLVRQA